MNVVREERVYDSSAVALLMFILAIVAGLILFLMSFAAAVSWIYFTYYWMEAPRYYGVNLTVAGALGSFLLSVGSAALGFWIFPKLNH